MSGKFELRVVSYCMSKFIKYNFLFIMNVIVNFLPIISIHSDKGLILKTSNQFTMAFSH